MNRVALVVARIEKKLASIDRLIDLMEDAREDIETSLEEAKLALGLSPQPELPLPGADGGGELGDRSDRTDRTDRSDHGGRKGVR